MKSVLDLKKLLTFFFSDVCPAGKELDDFCKILAAQRTLPTNFVRDVIMKAPSKDMMNTLSRSVLTLYSYDENPEDISLPNVLRQCINLISVFPMLSVYGYQAHKHYNLDDSLYIHNPEKNLSTAENILLMCVLISSTHLRGVYFRPGSGTSYGNIYGGNNPLLPSCGILLRYGYVFCHCSSPGFFKKDLNTEAPTLRWSVCSRI